MALSIYQRYYSEERGTVSYTGHFTGALMGLTMGTVILRNLKEHAHERVLKYVGLTFCIIGLLFAIVWNIVCE